MRLVESEVLTVVLCAQNCRLPYNLTDGNGTTYLPKAICYRLKLDLSDQIPNLIEAEFVRLKSKAD
jgi:putative protease